MESIINQTLKDIEIICINDGSTDNSLSILEEYSKKDNRIFIFSQSNKGPAAARNMGIDKSNGEYLYFMDADDILKLAALEETYDFALKKSADVVMFQAINWNSSEDRYYKTDIYDMAKIVKFYDGNVFDYNDLDDLIFHIPVTPWSKIYKIGEEHHSLGNFSNGVQKLLSHKLFDLFEEQDPDIVISTHFFMTEMVACLKKKKKTKCKLAVILTDYASHKFWLSSSEFVDLYFVANEQMRYTLLHEGIEESKINVTGIPVRPEFLLEYNKEKTFEEFGFSVDKPTFLVFGGGQYGMSDASKIFKGILDVKDDIQIIAIAGKSEKTKNTFEKLSMIINFLLIFANIQFPFLVSFHFHHPSIILHISTFFYFYLYFFPSLN